MYIIFSGAYGSLEAGLGWIFYISIIMWTIFIVGFYGAYKRAPSYLLVVVFTFIFNLISKYFIIKIFWTMVQGFILFFNFVQAIEHSACHDKPGHRCESPGSIALNWIAVIFLFIWWCAQVI